jgi:hypothetical protein
MYLEWSFCQFLEIVHSVAKGTVGGDLENWITDPIKYIYIYIYIYINLMSLTKWDTYCLLEEMGNVYFELKNQQTQA